MFWKPVQKKKAITNKEFSKLLAFVLKGNSTTTMKLADLSFALQVVLCSACLQGLKKVWL